MEPGVADVADCSLGVAECASASGRMFVGAWQIVLQLGL